LPAAIGKTWDIQITASESWDATSGTENVASGTADVKLVMVHNSGMRI
jgi:hypothetical protein